MESLQQFLVQLIQTINVEEQRIVEEQLVLVLVVSK
jgi:hypothetical protein